MPHTGDYGISDVLMEKRHESFIKRGPEKMKKNKKMRNRQFREEMRSDMAEGRQQ